MLVVSLIQLGWSSGLTLVPCELGERFSMSFVEVCRAIDEFNWYAFPISMQKALPIIFINAQEPVALKCFGGIICGRDVFKRVCENELIELVQLMHFRAILYTFFR